MLFFSFQNPKKAVALIKLEHFSLTVCNSVYKHKHLQTIAGEVKWWCVFEKMCVCQDKAALGQQGIPQGHIINDRPVRRTQRPLEQKMS